MSYFCTIWGNVQVAVRLHVASLTMNPPPPPLVQDAIYYSLWPFFRSSLSLLFGYIFGPAWWTQSTRTETLKPFELNSVRRLFSQEPLKIDVSNYCNSNFSNVSTFDKLQLCLPILIGASWFPPKEQHEAGIFSLSKKIACIFQRQIADQRHL